MNIKILQQNICKNNKKVKELMDSLLVNEPQVIFFSEFGYSKHKNEIIKRLEEREKYHIEMPLAFVEKRDKNKPCSCMMAVNE